MTIDELIEYYGSSTYFSRITGIDKRSWYRWIKKGYIPESAQMKIAFLSDGALKADLSKTKERLDDLKKSGEIIRRGRGRPKKSGV